METERYTCNDHDDYFLWLEKDCWKECRSFIEERTKTLTLTSEATFWVQSKKYSSNIEIANKVSKILRIRKRDIYSCKGTDLIWSDIDLFTSMQWWEAFFFTSIITRFLNKAILLIIDYYLGKYCIIAKEKPLFESLYCSDQLYRWHVTKHKSEA